LNSERRSLRREKRSRLSSLFGLFRLFGGNKAIYQKHPLANQTFLSDPQVHTTPEE